LSDSRVWLVVVTAHTEAPPIMIAAKSRPDPEVTQLLIVFSEQVKGLNDSTVFTYVVSDLCIFVVACALVCGGCWRIIATLRNDHSPQSGRSTNRIVSIASGEGSANVVVNMASAYELSKLTRKDSPTFFC